MRNCKMKTFCMDVKRQVSVNLQVENGLLIYIVRMKTSCIDVKRQVSVNLQVENGLLIFIVRMKTSCIDVKRQVANTCPSMVDAIS